MRFNRHTYKPSSEEQARIMQAVLNRKRLARWSSKMIGEETKDYHAAGSADLYFALAVIVLMGCYVLFALSLAW